MIAIVEIAGKQFKVAKGDTLEVPRLKMKEGDKITVDVLLKTDDKGTEIGFPTVAGSSVELIIKEHGKGDKIKIFKKKSKKRYERTQGHRQAHTIIEIASVK